jgi:hypothetical protein
MTEQRLAGRLFSINSRLIPILWRFASIPLQLDEPTSFNTEQTF